MPTYEVRRRTVVTSSVVHAANETEARCLARDVWQQDAAIASLMADVIRQPFPPDDDGDARSEARYEETDDDNQRRADEGDEQRDYAEERWQENAAREEAAAELEAERRAESAAGPREWPHGCL